MNYFAVIEQLKLALIELQYANADFQNKNEEDVTASPDTLDCIISRSQSAEIALQIAVDVLRNPSGNAEILHLPPRGGLKGKRHS